MTLSKRLGACALAAFAAAACRPASAQAPDAALQKEALFYKDKTVRVIVGHPPGGSYDFYARLAADALKEALPGVKAVIVENRPGGGGLLATSYLYQQGSPDGLTLAVLPETIGNTQVLEPTVGKWDVRRFRYIGSFVAMNSVFMRRKDSPVKTPVEMAQRQTIVGCTGTNAQSYQYPALMRRLAGYQYKMICGYPGAADYSLALKRGEIDLVSSAWTSWKVTNSQDIDSGALVPVIQAGLTRNAELAAVPLMQELVSDPDAKRVMEFASASAAIGRALIAPPGVSADRVAYLRHVFDEAMAGASVKAMAAQRRLDINPTSGAIVQQYADAIVTAPKAIVDATIEAYAE